jgi:hypothetical protein
LKPSKSASAKVVVQTLAKKRLRQKRFEELKPMKSMQPTPRLDEQNANVFGKNCDKKKLQSRRKNEELSRKNERRRSENVRRPNSNDRKKETNAAGSANKSARSVKGYGISKEKSDTRSATRIETVVGTQETGTGTGTETGTAIETETDTMIVTEIVVIMTDIGMIATRRSKLSLPN